MNSLKDVLFKKLLKFITKTSFSTFILLILGISGMSGLQIKFSIEVKLKFQLNFVLFMLNLEFWIAFIIKVPKTINIFINFLSFIKFKVNCRTINYCHLSLNFLKIEISIPSQTSQQTQTPKFNYVWKRKSKLSIVIFEWLIYFICRSIWMIYCPNSRFEIRFMEIDLFYLISRNIFFA